MTRHEIEDRIADLKRQHGAAVLDGKKFDVAKIAALENELDGFEAAEAERVRRQREQDERDARASHAHKVKRIGSLERDRLLAWSDMEVACRTLVEAIGRAKAATETQRVLWADLTAAVPTVLGPFDTAHRIRGRIGELLHAAKIGLDVPGAGGIYTSAALEDWREAERKAMAPNLQALEIENDD